MKRASETAEIIAAELPAQPSINYYDELRECDQVHIPPPAHVKVDDLNRFQVRDLNGVLTYEGTVEEACAADAAFDRLFRPSSTDNVHLIVCHGNIICNFLSRIVKEKLWRRVSVPNCGLTTIELHPNGQLELKSFADTDHLTTDPVLGKAEENTNSAYNYHEIEPKLFLSSYPISSEVLNNGRIDAIVNLCDFETPSYLSGLRPEISLVRQPFEDCWPIPTIVLTAATLELAELQRRGLATLVHCCAGRHRCPTLVALYLMARDGLSWNQAATIISSCRPHIAPESANEILLTVESQRGYGR